MNATDHDLPSPENRLSTSRISVKSCLVKVAWLIKRTIQATVLFIGIYLTIALVGLIPVNNDFLPTTDGIEIIIVSNLVHTDIFVPVQTAVIDWRTEFPASCFGADINAYSHVAFGWGDEGFFVNTPQWSDLTVATAFNALAIPSTTCMHVSYGYGNLYLPYGKSVRVSEVQYSQIVKQIQASFQRNEAGDLIQLPVSYDQNDAFFRAQGRYHCFNTCNSWTGRVLKSAGIRVPWFSPLPKTVFLWLPN